MTDSTVGKGPWRITHSEGKVLAIEVWQGAGKAGGNEVPAYAYQVTDGAPILYAAGLYREAERLFYLVNDEYQNYSEYTQEQADSIERWYWLMQNELDMAKHHLLRVALEG